MYSDYFGLSDSPFAITPDPRYLFLSQRHQEALAHLLFGVKEGGGGFVQLTGEVGTGKTMLIRALLEQLDENVDVALILNPRLTAFEFVASLCDDLHIHYPQDTSSLKILINYLNDFLLRAHAQRRRVILIVDEAQNFQADVLEQIRLLTNLETAKQKLLQIILVGQPELRDLLSTVNLRQLAQRVTARYHLVPMTDEEARGYIKHRLRVAGASHPLFTDGAITQVIKLSKGVPRLINIICDRALLGAYSKDSYQVKASIVKHAAREVGGKTDFFNNNGKWVASVGVLSLVVMMALIGYMNIFDVEFESVAQKNSPVLLAKVAPEPFQIDSKSPTLKTISSPENEIEGEAEIEEGDQELYEVLLVSELKNRLTQTATTDLNEVFLSLFTRWELEYSLLSGRTGCERATSVRLRCYWGSATWSNFLALNRPAILWFEGKEARHYMAVLAIIDDYAEVSVGGEDFIVELNDLESIWPDQYLILWRPPALGLGVIRPGDSGELVLWLRRNLDKIDGVKPSSKNAHLFDQKLKTRVKAFQLAHDLEVDGVVGSRTMMYLNVALGDISIPLLNIEE